MSDFDYAYAAAYGDQDMHFDQWSYWESAEWQFCQCDVIGWCGCLGLFPGGHTIFVPHVTQKKLPEILVLPQGGVQ